MSSTAETLVQPLAPLAGRLFLRVLGCDITVDCGDNESLKIISRCYSAFLQPHEPADTLKLGYQIKKSDVRAGWFLHCGDSTIACRDAADLLYDFEKDMTIRVQLQRKDLLFVHAAVVGHAGGCCVFAGQSGAGKSTLCWALCHAGFDYISDELAPINPQNRQVESYPHALCLKSEPPRYPLPMATIRTTATMHVPVNSLPGWARTGSSELRSIVFIEAGGDKAESSLSSISASEAAARLYANSLNQLAHTGSGLPAAAAIASGVPAYLLHRGQSGSVDIVAELLAA